MGSRLELRLKTKDEDGSNKICIIETEIINRCEIIDLDHFLKCSISEDLDIRRITTLQLSKSNLTDIPVIFKNLNLKHLDLSHNRLLRVPTCLYNGLPHLISLNLSFNKISNFDQELCCLPYVERVKINNNTSRNIPMWFKLFKAPNLREFDYSRNRVRHCNYTQDDIYNFDQDSPNIDLMNLEKLELRSCLIWDYTFLTFFKKLKHLDLSNEEMKYNRRGTGSNHSVTIQNVIQMEHWKQLEVLRLNSIHMIIPERIQNMTKLKELHITHNYICYLPKEIQFLVNLEVLDVSHNDMFALPDELVLLKYLRIILAPFNILSSLPDVTCLKKLKILDLYCNQLKDIHCDINNLDQVDLEYNFYDTSELVQLYNIKKDRLRKTYPFDCRKDGIQTYNMEDDVPVRYNLYTCYSDESGESDDSYWDEVPRPREDLRYVEEESWD